MVVEKQWAPTHLEGPGLYRSDQGCSHIWINQPLFCGTLGLPGRAGSPALRGWGYSTVAQTIGSTPCNAAGVRRLSGIALAI